MLLRITYIYTNVRLSSREKRNWSEEDQKQDGQKREMRRVRTLNNYNRSCSGGDYQIIMVRPGGPASAGADDPANDDFAADGRANEVES
jgi:hypothetical protein